MSLLSCKQHAERNCVICYPSPRDSMVIELLDKVMVLEEDIADLLAIIEHMRRLRSAISSDKLALLNDIISKYET